MPKPAAKKRSKKKQRVEVKRPCRFTKEGLFSII